MSHTFEVHAIRNISYMHTLTSEPSVKQYANTARVVPITNSLTRNFEALIVASCGNSLLGRTLKTILKVC